MRGPGSLAALSSLVGFRLGLAGRPSRTSSASRENPLGLPIRRLILQEIRAHPGLHYREISRRLGIANGELSEHLRRLESAGLIRHKYWLGRKHFFGVEFVGDFRLFMLSGWDRLAFGYLVGHPGSSASDLVSALGNGQGAASVHLSRLRALGVVEARRSGRVLQWYARPAAQLSGFAPKVE